MLLGNLLRIGSQNAKQGFALQLAELEYDLAHVQLSNAKKELEVAR